MISLFRIDDESKLSAKSAKDYVDLALVLSKSVKSIDEIKSKVSSDTDVAYLMVLIRKLGMLCEWKNLALGWSLVKISSAPQRSFPYLLDRCKTHPSHYSIDPSSSLCLACIASGSFLDKPEYNFYYLPYEHKRPESVRQRHYDIEFDPQPNLDFALTERITDRFPFGSGIIDIKSLSLKHAQHTYPGNSDLMQFYFAATNQGIETIRFMKRDSPSGKMHENELVIPLKEYIPNFKLPEITWNPSNAKSGLFSDLLDQYHQFFPYLHKMTLEIKDFQIKHMLDLRILTKCSLDWTSEYNKYATGVYNHRNPVFIVKSLRTLVRSPYHHTLDLKEMYPNMDFTKVYQFLAAISLEFKGLFMLTLDLHNHLTRLDSNCRFQFHQWTTSLLRGYKDLKTVADEIAAYLHNPELLFSQYEFCSIFDDFHDHSTSNSARKISTSFWFSYGTRLLCSMIRNKSVQDGERVEMSIFNDIPLTTEIWKSYRDEYIGHLMTEGNYTVRYKGDQMHALEWLLLARVIENKPDWFRLEDTLKSNWLSHVLVEYYQYQPWEIQTSELASWVFEVKSSARLKSHNNWREYVLAYYKWKDMETQFDNREYKLLIGIVDRNKLKDHLLKYPEFKEFMEVRSLS